MRIRTQIIASACLCGIVALFVAAGLSYVTRQAQAGLDEQAESQEVARDVANLLALTNEFSVYGGERATSQWRARYQVLAARVEHAIARRAAPAPQLIDLRRTVQDLSPLFEKLVEVGRMPQQPLAQRRRELLTERLLAETQEIAESRHRWAVVIGQAQQADQRLYTAMVLSAPAALLMLLLALGYLTLRRVLVPLAQLKAAAAAIQRGDLDVRCSNGADDELGEAARAVDLMAAALQAQSAALRTSQQRLQTIADNIPAMIGYVDKDEIYRFTNARYQRLAGEQADSYLGRTMAEVLGPATRAALAPHVEAVLRGERREFERHGLGKATKAYFLVNYLPDLNEDGGVDGFYVMAMDITTRREAELRQQASERLLVDITDNLPALVAYIDRDQRYRFANGKYREWLGIEPATMLGRTVREALGEDFFNTVEVHGTAALAGRRVRHERQTVQDGREVHYLSDFIPDVGADGEVRGFYALTIDITERREAELSVARSEQRLLDLMNNIPALVGYFDMDERCQYANDTALRTQGLDRASIPGIALRDALGTTNYAQHLPHVRQALAGRRVKFGGAIPFRSRTAHFQAHLIPDRIEGGAQRGFFLMTFDITELKEAQAQQAQVERKLLAITDNLPVLITYIDRDERYAFVNATSRPWLGVEPSALVGRTFAESMSPENYEQRRHHLQTALSGQRVEFNVDSEAYGRTRNLQSVYIPDISADGSVAGVYTLSSDVTALKQVERQLSQLARIDALTGLPNRRQFEERVAEGLARASRTQQPIGLMFLDVDFFKAINDSLGHAGGDEVLKEFAQRLSASVRMTDLPARLAGDEFVVLLEGLHDRSDAEVVAQKIVDAMREPFTVGGRLQRVTASVGVAFCSHPAADQPLMLMADEALYAAKKAGRNTYRVLPEANLFTGTRVPEAAGP